MVELREFQECVYRNNVHCCYLVVVVQLRINSLDIDKSANS